MAQDIIIILKCQGCARWIVPLGEDRPCVCGAIVFDPERVAEDRGRGRPALERYALDLDTTMSLAGSMKFASLVRAVSRPREDAAGSVISLIACDGCQEWTVDGGCCACGVRPKRRSPSDTFLLDVDALVRLLESERGSSFRDFILSDYRAPLAHAD